MRRIVAVIAGMLVYLAWNVRWRRKERRERREAEYLLTGEAVADRLGRLTRQ